MFSRHITIAAALTLVGGCASWTKDAYVLIATADNQVLHFRNAKLIHVDTTEEAWAPDRRALAISARSANDYSIHYQDGWIRYVRDPSGDLTASRLGDDVKSLRWNRAGDRFALLRLVDPDAYHGLRLEIWDDDGEVWRTDVSAGNSRLDWINVPWEHGIAWSASERYLVLSRMDVSETWIIAIDSEERFMAPHLSNAHFVEGDELVTGSYLGAPSRWGSLHIREIDGNVHSTSTWSQSALGVRVADADPERRLVLTYSLSGILYVHDYFSSWRVVDLDSGEVWSLPGRYYTQRIGSACFAPLGEEILGPRQKRPRVRPSFTCGAVIDRHPPDEHRASQ